VLVLVIQTRPEADNLSTVLLEERTGVIAEPLYVRLYSTRVILENPKLIDH
jgi:hypothetical protein